MSKKLSPSEKVKRSKVHIQRALNVAKFNKNKLESLGYLIGTLAHVYATLEADKDDPGLISHLAYVITEDVSPKAREKLELHLDFLGKDYEQKSFVD